LVVLLKPCWIDHFTIMKCLLCPQNTFHLKNYFKSIFSWYYYILSIFWLLFSCSTYFHSCYLFVSQNLKLVSWR
jgi:hypothetical protein